LRLPVLSIITWSPFVATLIIMFFARYRPLLVRLTAVISSAISRRLHGRFALGLAVYGAW